MEINRINPARIIILVVVWAAIAWVSSIGHKVHADAPGPNLNGVSAAAYPFFYDVPVNRFNTSQAGTQLSNPTSNTTFSDFYNIPANDPHLTVPGSGFDIVATGNVTVAAAGTVTMSLNVAETDRVHAVITLGAAATNVPWLFRARFHTQAVGSSGTANGYCEFAMPTATGNITTSYAIGVVDPPFAIDTTAANDVGVGTLFGTSNGSNKIIMKSLQVRTTR